MFVTDGVSPSRRIAQLRRLVSWLDSTRNQMFAPIALALLLPQQLAVAIDQVACRVRPARRALAASHRRARSVVGDRNVRVRASAGSVSRHSRKADRCFDARAARPSADDRRGRRCATTSCSAAALRRILVISGSNMSGKSTLLRSVGVNVVLALAGAPVRATRADAVAARARRDAQSRGLAAGGALAVLRRDSPHSRHRRGRAGGGIRRRAVSARRDPARHELLRSPHRRRSDRPGARRGSARSASSRRTTSR